MPNLPRKNVDPYRELGVARAATDAEIKKAHRALAKRFHPDAGGGDAARFLIVQEAYSLLSDPVRRREWDAKHSPSPVRANEPRKPRARGADGRWTREEGTPSSTRQRTASSRRPRQPEQAHDPEANGPRQATWSGSDRPSGTRSYRWSAENVPWWEDFAPKNGAGRGQAHGSERSAKAKATRADAASEGTSTAGSQEPPRPASGSARAGAKPPTPGAGSAGSTGNEFDVYSRSSGAAWSSAARQYFRKASEDLPSRGSFVYRGTQVVTGATARKVAEELLRQRPGVDAAPRQAFESRDRPPSGTSQARASEPKPAAAGGASAAPRPPVWTRPEPQDDRDARPEKQPGVLATAAVGGVGGLVVTLPALALGMTMLNPPLQPAFAAILLLLAAVAGAVAATLWMKVKP
jgi:curved DNA-binding protein CbpA